MDTQNTPSNRDGASRDPLRSTYRFSSGAKSDKAADRPSQPETARVVVPTAPKTRPRGRLLIAGLMFAACSAGIFTVWESLLRYKAYGVVTGQIVHVAAPVDGVL